MTETFAEALGRLRDIARGQAVGYRRLLAATTEGNEALRTNDVARFERTLAEQATTLHELKALERERALCVKEVGAMPAQDELTRELRDLAQRVSSENRVRRFVTSRREALTETRLGFRRRLGILPDDPPGSVNAKA
ncbi:MAG TPA: hypothetical protein VFR10_14120 [bacterium]|nr:hypothetical protein [bacterium]